MYAIRSYYAEMEFERKVKTMSEKFVQPELGFAYNALESAIDAQTMEILV